MKLALLINLRLLTNANSFLLILIYSRENSCSVELIMKKVYNLGVYCEYMYAGLQVDTQQNILLLRLPVGPITVQYIFKYASLVYSSRYDREFIAGVAFFLFIISKQQICLSVDGD